MNIEKVKLSHYTSLRIGGEGDVVRVKNKEELLEAIEYIKKENDGKAASEARRLHILGLGTNTFFDKNTSKLLIIKIENKGISLNFDDNKCTLTAAAGEAWDDVVKYAVENNLWGIENLSYIPGTAGAAPVQNIGAYGVELGDILDSVLVLDLEKTEFIRLNCADLDLGYRDSIFKKVKNKYIIWEIKINLTQKHSPTLSYAPLTDIAEESRATLTPASIREIVIKTRKSKIPDYGVFPNAGSFFKNPLINKGEVEKLTIKYPDVPHFADKDKYKVPAAWLIEHVANMKGIREGRVGTWKDQCLVLVNYDGGNAEDVLNFSQKIIDRVKENTGIVLEREVNYIK